MRAYRYVPPRNVVVLGLFGLKTLESGMGFEETTGAYISMNVFIVSIPMNKNEIKIYANSNCI